MINRYFLGGLLCFLASTFAAPVLADTNSAPQLVAQFFDIGPVAPPTTFQEIIPLKGQDPAKFHQYLFEWHERLLLVYDGKTNPRYDRRVRGIVRELGLTKKDLPVYCRNISSLIGRMKLAHDKLPAQDILGPLPIMNITSGKNQPLSGFHSDEEVKAWIKNRMR